MRDSIKKLARTVITKYLETKKFLYEFAGEDAPPEVAAAIQRFRNLPYEERIKEPLLYWLLGESTQDYKISQEESQYVDVTRMPGQTCENCAFGYIELATLNTEDEKIICSQIQGYIKRAGWCNRWKLMGTIKDESIYQSEQMLRQRDINRENYS